MSGVWVDRGQHLWSQNGALNVLCTRVKGPWVCVQAKTWILVGSPSWPNCSASMQPTLGQLGRNWQARSAGSFIITITCHFLYSLTSGRTNAGASGLPSPSQWYPHSSFPASNWTKLTPLGHVHPYCKVNWGQGNYV